MIPRICSDHTLLVLKSGSWEHKKSYFNFEGWWLETVGFNEKLKDWWASFEFVGRLDCILATKLTALKAILKDWSSSSYRNLEKNKNLILSKIADFDSIQQSRSLIEEWQSRKLIFFMNFEDYAKKEEIAWRQISRTLWIKKGDKNTKFFQRIANARKRNNHIDKLMVEGKEIVESKDIKREINSFY
ncbi:uncharacterized protein LOC132639639 [Lycium barbarum]|uniref:uncharacterized protein LOC132639639 n=1 Tax=Lycium barbarum TaxID=112863 RepID=UPI00293F027E|nr:uncharacterized protein LOC132639639 [Lycium barbarum]